MGTLYIWIKAMQLSGSTSISSAFRYVSNPKPRHGKKKHSGIRQPSKISKSIKDPQHPITFPMFELWWFVNQLGARAPPIDEVWRCFHNPTSKSCRFPLPHPTLCGQLQAYRNHISLALWICRWNMKRRKKTCAWSNGTFKVFWGRCAKLHFQASPSCWSVFKA